MWTAVAVVLFVFTCNAAELLQVSVLHRHGAREECILVHGQLDCSTANLTPAGEQMALQLGAALRQRYSTSFLPAMWESDLVSSLSTDLSRTIQTGFGMLTGLFTANDSIAFLKHVAPISKDYMLAFPYNFPNRQLTSDYWNSVESCDELAREVLGDQGVEILVSEFGSWCAQQPMRCGLFAEDCCQCRISNGGMSSNLSSIFPQLLELQMMYNKWTYGTNTSSPFFPAGSLGYPLAETMLTNAAVAVNSSGRNITRLFHYSAHDNTIVGLYAALGSVTLDSNDTKTWVPRFAQTVLMEVYSNGSVSFFHAVPHLEANSSFAFRSFDPLSIQCLLPSGLTSQSSVCTIEGALASLRKASAPSSREIVDNTTSPQCWLPKEFRSRCYEMDTSPSPVCASFRSQCQNACLVLDVNSVLNPVDFSCDTFVNVAFSDNAAPAIFGAVGALFLGMVLGRLILNFVEFEEVHHPEETSYIAEAVDEEEKAIIVSESDDDESLIE